jgi:hypothetical protein
MLGGFVNNVNNLADFIKKADPIPDEKRKALEKRV